SIKEPSLLYIYKPKTGDLDRVIASMDRAYNEQRVTVITCIFSKPNYKIRTFKNHAEEKNSIAKR
ncbi:MAG: hypothetical protein AB1489_10340, partial [Acidobacteriota bacterium]